MGFTAYFSLYVRDIDGNTIGDRLNEIQQWIDGREIGCVLNGLAFIELDETEAVCDSDGTPWKDEYDNDLTELSEQFPGFVFNLRVEGEERDDFWDRYYLKGDSEDCHMICEMPKPKRIPWECSWD